MKYLLSVALVLSAVVVLVPIPNACYGASAPGAPLRTLTGHTDWVNAVAITPDGTKIVSGSSDNTLKVWNMP